MNPRLIVVMLFCFSLSTHVVQAADEPCNGVAKEGDDHTLICRLSGTNQGLLWQLQVGSSFVNVSTCSSAGDCTNSIPDFFVASLVNDSDPAGAGGYVGRLRILSVNRTKNTFKCASLDFTQSQTCRLQAYVTTQKPTCQDPSWVTIATKPYLQVTCVSDSVYPEGNCNFQHKGPPKNISTAINVINSPSRTSPGNYRTQCTWLAALTGVPPGFVQVQAEVYPGTQKFIEAASSYSEWIQPVVLDYPTVKLADDCRSGLHIRNGYILEGTEATCLCVLTSPGQPAGFAQWFTQDGNKTGIMEANGSASLTLRRGDKVPAGTVYECRPQTALMKSVSQTQVLFAPRNAVGPKAVGIDISDSFPLCPNESQTFLITCKVHTDNIVPRPLFTIIINSATAISNQAGTLEDSFYTVSHTFRPGRGGKLTIYCKATNEIFPERSAELERTLMINEPPRLAPKFKTQNGQPDEGSRDAYIPEGGHAFLSCTVEGGYPSVSNVTIVCGGHSNTVSGPYGTIDLRIPDGETTLPCSCAASHVTGCYHQRTEIVLTSVVPESSSNSNNTSNSNNLSLGLGVGLGVAIGIIIILFIAFIIVHKRKGTSTKGDISQRFDYSHPDSASRTSHPYASVMQVTPEPPPRPHLDLLGQNDYDLISLNAGPVRDTTILKYLATDNESSSDRVKGPVRDTTILKYLATDNESSSDRVKGPVRDTTILKYLATDNESSSDRVKENDLADGYIQPI